MIEFLISKYRALLIEKRIPVFFYRILFRNKKVEKAYVNNQQKRLCKVLTGALKTPFFSFNPDSQTELHTLLSHELVNAYLIAVKSFLRFYDNVSGCVYDDGSLTKKDCETLKSHLKNVRIIARAEADALISKNLCSSVKHLKSANIFYLKLVGIALFARKKKNIVMDCDIIFFRKPEEIIKWIEEDIDCSYFNQHPCVPVERCFKIEEIERKYNIKIPIQFNAGFLCIRDNFSICEIEEAYNILNNYRIDGDERLTRLQNSFMEQWIYTLLFACRTSAPLNAESYFVFYGDLNYDHSVIDGAKMIHFVSPFRFFYGLYVRMATKTIQELLRRRN